MDSPTSFQARSAPLIARCSHEPITLCTTLSPATCASVAERHVISERVIAEFSMRLSTARPVASC